MLGPGELARNVKLGRGGIREIEFTLQTLSSYTELGIFFYKENTLRALSALQASELMPLQDILFLHKAYVFLRKVEHRLQIEQEAQIHTVP